MQAVFLYPLKLPYNLPCNQFYDLPKYLYYFIIKIKSIHKRLNIFNILTQNKTTDSKIHLLPVVFFIHFSIFLLQFQHADEQTAYSPKIFLQGCLYHLSPFHRSNAFWQSFQPHSQWVIPLPLS